jgi:HD superfamily phosphodiesterase
MPTIDDALALLASLPQPLAGWFLRPNGHDGSLGLHGLGHTRRVLVHAALIADALEVTSWERQAVILAALWHDIGRDSDGTDPYHGAKSAGKVVGLGLHRGVASRLRDVALYAVTYHSGGERAGEHAAQAMADANAALRVFRMLKDADALDRVRLGDLDAGYFRFDVTRGQVDLARQLLAAIG